MSREVLRAILRNNIDKLDSLLQDGTNIREITEKERWNYLHRTLLSITKPPTPKIIQYLIDLGVDVNAVDIYGNTPLHYAARLKDSELIKILLDAHASINYVNEEGVSPLRQMLLTKPFDYDSIKLLLDAGADIEQKTEGGVSIKTFADTVAEDTKLTELFNQ